jgi:hypothetical protein
MTQSNDQTRFLLCVSAGDYPVSLEARKVYLTLSDPEAEVRGMVRVVDESGEDYLYPHDLFVPVELTAPTVETLMAAEAA